MFFSVTYWPSTKSPMERKQNGIFSMDYMCTGVGLGHQATEMWRCGGGTVQTPWPLAPRHAYVFWGIQLFSCEGPKEQRCGGVAKSRGNQGSELWLGTAVMVFRLIKANILWLSTFLVWTYCCLIWVCVVVLFKMYTCARYGWWMTIGSKLGLFWTLLGLTCVFIGSFLYLRTVLGYKLG